jgi:hypothetical protein
MRIALTILLMIALITWRLFLTLITTPVSWCRWVDDQVDKFINKYS